MRKKGKKITRTATRAPTCVALMLHPEVSLAERMAVHALGQNYGGAEHYNVLWDCHSMLVFGSEGKHDTELSAVIAMSQIALANIRDRFVEHGVVRCTGDELSALHEMADFSERWWKRAGGQRFERAYNEVTRSREMYRQQEKAAKAAAETMKEEEKCLR